METYRKEIDRLMQVEIAKALKAPAAGDETTEAYAVRLVYNLGVPIENIREVLP